MSLLACALLFLLLWSVPAQKCKRDQFDHQGLDPISLSTGATYKSRELDPSRCWEECCNAPDCDLVLVGFPMDGRPQCLLVNCTVGNSDICSLRPDPQFSAFRKNVARDGKVPHVVPLLGARRPETGENSETPKNLETQRVSNESSYVLCRLPVKVGKCRAAFPRFYYDSTNQSCRRFTFGGCDSNNNNFKTQEECEATCRGVSGPVLPDDSTPAPPEKTARKAPVLEHRPSERAGDDDDGDDEMSSEYKAHCMVPPESGECRAAFSMYFFDAHTSTCQKFTYGGCRGNKNRYNTKEECEQVCITESGSAGHSKPRQRLTAAIFLFVTLASVSALLLAALIVITLRRHRLSGRASSISDKEELLPDPDDSLIIPESPTPPQA